MRVFVTGGSGFVGGHVLEALVPHHRVSAMARSARSAAKVEALGAEAVHVGLDDITAEHLAGVELVIHAAAFVEEWGPAQTYFDVNVGGTTRLLEAAGAAGVSRFVLVSTNAAVFDGLGQRGVDETADYPAHKGFPYGASKAEAERRVLAANEQGFTTLAVRPCFVWGPRDASVLPALRRMTEDGGFVWLDQGRALISTTHVANLVHGIERAMVEGVGGSSYFLADEHDLRVREFLEGLAAADGFELATRSVPGALVRGLATALEVLYRTFGWTKTPPVTRMAALLMSRDMTVCTTKARAELGWAPVIDRESGLEGLGA